VSLELPFKISALVFTRDEDGRFLLIKRRKAPNLGCWSPIGGKLDMDRGESPYECARREVKEEIGLDLEEDQLRLFGYISEKNYEGSGHWLMFLFDCHLPLKALPPAIDEGHFAFFTREAIDSLPIPETDARLLWPYYDRYRRGFIGLRADCDPAGALRIDEELAIQPEG
jgi:8-oxo-dGTP diphosphatase